MAALDTRAAEVLPPPTEQPYTLDLDEHGGGADATATAAAEIDAEAFQAPARPAHAPFDVAEPLPLPLQAAFEQALKLDLNIEADTPADTPAETPTETTAPVKAAVWRKAAQADTEPAPAPELPPVAEPEPQAASAPEAAGAAPAPAQVPAPAPEPLPEQKSTPWPEPQAEREPLPEHVSAPWPEAEVEVEVEAEAEAWSMSAPAAAFAPPAEPQAESAAAPSARLEPVLAASTERGVEQRPSAQSAAAAAAAAATASDDHAGGADEEPGFVKRDRRKQRVGKAARIVMALGSLLLLAALATQAVGTFRNPLAAYVPALKPALLAICARAGCKIELPSQIDELSIEPGELLTVTDTTFSFVTQLRNQGGVGQAWPHIELTLNDANDKPVLRRVFTPRDYLASQAEVDKGFSPRSEQSVKLYFELAQIKASGYHIAVFYP
ncbi:DUF3426 domain-containing protein [Rugamonas sp. CCM 8940]|uniref:DUF3426 domain-containing protein n=1 Tax=Rugamonas sp. CCM 8940 TaxID=2765359 RepID=UPI0018F37081|nr:DUF3426 domain-containing protein [Rugamonas sp. CCM 8940]